MELITVLSLIRVLLRPWRLLERMMKISEKRYDHPYPVLFRPAYFAERRMTLKFSD